MTAYYNETDPYAAEWLLNLIKEGHIAPGVVDQRSIEDVCPSDLSEFTQCHFFAGVGVWSYALRAAGVPDDFPVWTGSCPCQPFSAAGKGAGFADERHLWPAWHHLIRECKPGLVLGEQVASKDALAWLDVVQPDLEAAGYAFGAVDLCAAGVGAPHIRQRLWFVAHAGGTRLERRRGVRQRAAELAARARGVVSGMADTADQRLDRWRTSGASDGRNTAWIESERLRDAGGVADASGVRRVGRQGVQAGCLDDGTHAGRLEGDDGPFGIDEARISRIEPTGPTNGFWRDADWLACRDGKFRPVEPGSFPLAHGAPARVGRLRAYGNAINAEAARHFIESAFEAIDAYDLI